MRTKNVNSFYLWFSFSYLNIFLLKMLDNTYPFIHIHIQLKCFMHQIMIFWQTNSYMDNNECFCTTNPKKKEKKIMENLAWTMDSKTRNLIVNTHSNSMILYGIFDYIVYMYVFHIWWQQRAWEIPVYKIKFNIARWCLLFIPECFWYFVTIHST